MRDEFAHDGELEDGLFELVDTAFGGEEGVEVGLDALPGFGKLGGVRRCGGQCQKRGDQGFVGVETALLLLLKLIAQRHQLIDFGDDAVLFGEGWEWEGRAGFLRIEFEEFGAPKEPVER